MRNNRISGGDTVSIKIEDLPKEKSFEILLRIPSFCKKTQVLINGNQGNATVGSYFSAKRVWKKGDKIEFLFTVELEIIKAPQNPLEKAEETILPLSAAR